MQKVSKTAFYVRAGLIDFHSTTNGHADWTSGGFLTTQVKMLHRQYPLHKATLLQVVPPY